MARKATFFPPTPLFSQTLDGSVAKPDKPVRLEEADHAFRFRHLPELDGFRGAAILFVVVGHFVEVHGATASVRYLGQCAAQLGVLLFFVLSGFLITSLLHKEREATGTISFRLFYIRRVLRLSPALALFLTTVAVLMGLGLIT